MGIKDLIVTPTLLTLLIFLAYLVRPKVTSIITRKYFVPGLSVRIIGALALGMIYQFYYQGGDTFNLYFRDAGIVWTAFLDSPLDSLKIVFLGESYQPSTFKYASRMISIGDPESFLVVRVAGLFGLLTFNTYSAIAVLFAVWSFSGMWALYTVFVRFHPALSGQLAIAILFIPSVFFWGSGVLKDTLTLGAIGWLIYGYYLFQNRGSKFLGMIIVIGASAIIYSIKIYILLCLIPSLLLWSYVSFNQMIRPAWLRVLSLPITIVIFLFLGFYGVTKIAEGDPRYSMNQLAQTAYITAYDIRYYTGRTAGSGYSLGELDGSVASIAALAPAALNVSLFRPYIWEVKNPLMLLAALESLFITMLTLWVVYKSRVFGLFSKTLKDPIILFCLMFSLILAFGVGVSTYNFGSLARYRIPLLPFYVSAMLLIAHHLKRDRKLSRLLETA